MKNRTADWDIRLRGAVPADYRQTEYVTREAFWNRYAPGCCEHYLLHVLRGTQGFVPELDLVAVHDGRIVGHVLSVRGVIETDDGRRCEVLTLGPISVLPAYQGRGVGRRLIERTLTVAREAGFRAVLLCGDPDYYLRRGFVPAETLGIRTADNRYAAALHVCELRPGALAGSAGRYVEDAAYEVDESAVEAFDSEFPEKEKLADTPSQERFRQIVAMSRSAQ